MHVTFTLFISHLKSDVHYLPRASNSTAANFLDMLPFSNLWNDITTFLFDHIVQSKSEEKCILRRDIHDWSFVCLFLYILVCD